MSMNLNDNTDIEKSEVLTQLLSPLKPYMEKNDVTEVTINRPYEVWLKTCDGWIREGVPALSFAYLQSLVTSVVVYNGLEPTPIISGKLPGGKRVEIVQPPACIEDTLSFCIRNHLGSVKTLEELDQEGAFDSWKDVSFNRPTFDEVKSSMNRNDFGRLDEVEARLLSLKESGDITAFLSQAVINHRNMIISGKTGSGKTTFARSLIEKVPIHERLITIEDTHELFLENHPNRFHRLYGKNAGRVTADESLSSCMRQSPDRIFLAELRGSEALEYLESLNTGHPGSITTTHANNALQTFARVASLVRKSPMAQDLNQEAIKEMIYSTLDIVLFYKQRKLVEVFYDPIFAKSHLN